MRARALVLLLALLAACSNPPKPVAPLVPASTPTPGRPAPAMVQVENAPDSRPHSGLQNADLVYEYLTEGGITRFTVIYFDPSGSGKIGPVRSARLVTLRLVKSYSGVLFYSGASDKVQGLIWDSKIPNYSEGSNGGKYFKRDSSRVAPHNLYSSGDQLKSGVSDSNAKVTYTLPSSGEPSATGDGQVTKFSFAQTDVHSVSYAYDSGSKTYQYTTDGGPEIDTDNSSQPLKITNVVLIRVAHHDAGYTEDVLGENGIDFDLQGTGKADVYTRGQHFAAGWDLSDPAKPLRLTTADGKDFTLPQGLTWIHLVDPNMAVQAG
ncbi:MAG TPA: DUF3048 domain-containing protein [Candidatus Dormibacteraeota bacterium]